jgi:hypothetical protein
MALRRCCPPIDLEPSRATDDPGHTERGEDGSAQYSSQAVWVAARRRQSLQRAMVGSRKDFEKQIR